VKDFFRENKETEGPLGEKARVAVDERKPLSFQAAELEAAGIIEPPIADRNQLRALRREQLNSQEPILLNSQQFRRAKELMDEIDRLKNIPPLSREELIQMMEDIAIKGEKKVDTTERLNVADRWITSFHQALRTNLETALMYRETLEEWGKMHQLNLPEFFYALCDIEEKKRIRSRQCQTSPQRGWPESHVSVISREGIKFLELMAEFTEESAEAITKYIVQIKNEKMKLQGKKSERLNEPLEILEELLSHLSEEKKAVAELMIFAGVDLQDPFVRKAGSQELNKRLEQRFQEIREQLSPFEESIPTEIKELVQTITAYFEKIGKEGEPSE
jgi:hypothetical protein